MRIVLAIGAACIVVGAAWLLNVFGAGDYMIKRVTSHKLGTLPAGFAATTRGFRTYSVLVIAVGLVCVGVGASERNLAVAGGLIVAGAITFGLASMLAIAGEVETSRSKRG